MSRLPAMTIEPEASPARRKSGGSFWRELPILLIIALGLALLIKTFLMQAFYIPSGSMEDTLQVGDRVLVNKLAYKFSDVQRGDVVVFNGVDSWTGEVQVAEETETRSCEEFARSPGHSASPLPTRRTTSSA